MTKIPVLQKLIHMGRFPQDSVLPCFISKKKIVEA